MKYLLLIILSSCTLNEVNEREYNPIDQADKEAVERLMEMDSLDS